MSTETAIIDLKSYRVLKEARNLFRGYRQRVMSMQHNEFIQELSRYRQEIINFPNHLLTLVKGEILMAHAIEHSKTLEMKAFAIQETNRIQLAIELRIYRYLPLDNKP